MSAGADLLAETDDFQSVFDMADNDRMLLVVGRAMIVTYNSGDQNELPFCEQEVFEPVFDPDRETCIN